MIHRILHSFLLITCYCYCYGQPLPGESEKKLKIVFNNQNTAFPIVQNKKSVPFIIDEEDAAVVKISAEAVANDIKMITDTKPTISNTLQGDYVIIAGTIGHSKLINQLDDKLKQAGSDAIIGKWESCIITTIDNPIKGIKKALVVAGSDRRGTAYGLFELSRMAGVSPWVWWADVKPAKSNSLYVTSGTIILGEPSVKYRGIFLNDEDWGLKPWATRNMDTDIKDIGPKTYARIFELLLRLRANMIWPAMHDCTKAFYYYPENPVVADRYAIVVGGSHCEPMLRNNVFEWKKNYVKEYGSNPPDWRYDTSKEQIYRYWDDRIKASHNYESVYTIGMRGIHDGSMPGPKTMSGKKLLMDTVIRDQRVIFSRYFKSPQTVPQIFCPYKEMLDIYNLGLQLPEDVTMMWADDNYGYIRQLSNTDEQKRSGGAGVYYHISYLGRPHDYIWMESTPVALIWNEMHKAYETNAKNVWMLNVGDLKACEIGLNFFMDMAWNINQFNPSELDAYYNQFAAEQFGDNNSHEIGNLLKQYFQLAFPRRPEFMGWSTTFPTTPTKDPDYSVADNNDEAQKRIDAYDKLEEQTVAMYNSLPDRLKDAFFQLIGYKVIGASNMNKKVLYAYKSRVYAKLGRLEANKCAQLAQQAFEKIKTATAFYNDTMASEKWKGMMSWNPRKLPVYDMPKTDTVAPGAIRVKEFTQQIQPKITIEAEKYTSISNTQQANWSLIQGLGLENDAMGSFPVTALPQKMTVQLKYTFSTQQKGEATIRFYCLPSQPINGSYKLRFGLSLNNEQPNVIDAALNEPIDEDHNQEWRTNVLRNTVIREAKINLQQTGNQMLTISMIDPGVVLDKMEIVFNK